MAVSAPPLPSPSPCCVLSGSPSCPGHGAFPWLHSAHPPPHEATQPTLLVITNHTITQVASQKEARAGGGGWRVWPRVARRTCGRG